jgi:hypothetical protein
MAYNQPMLDRNIVPNVAAALADTPVVFLNGARQSGKSTLARSLVDRGLMAEYLTLDDPAALAAAQDDPGSFVAGRERLVIDEVQRVPDLFVALKATVDRDRRPGRFLLTGSANVLLLPGLAQTLAGRMEILPLWPFSQGELESRKEGFLDAAFKGTSAALYRSTPPMERRELLARLLAGGFPEAAGRKSEDRRNAWFSSYVGTLLQREIRDMANVDGLASMPRLLGLIATHAGSLSNYSELSRSSGLPLTTLKRYVALWEAAYLVQPLPAWSANLGKRLVRSPKLYLNDSGLLAYLLQINPQRLGEQPALWGPLLENFVVMELHKQAAWSRTKPRIFHFRSHAGQEVDVVLEDRAGRVVGIEIKARAAASGEDFRALRALAAGLGKRFVAGIVLYTGAGAYPFGPRLYALPVSALWRI